TNEQQNVLVCRAICNCNCICRDEALAKPALLEDVKHRLNRRIPHDPRSERLLANDLVVVRFFHLHDVWPSTPFLPSAESATLVPRKTTNEEATIFHRKRNA